MPPGVAPAVILVEPQLAENIGMTARAMANFGLSELRLVNPKNGWPKKGVREAASGATHVLDRATIFGSVAEAIADCTYVLATTARERGQMKRVFAPEEAMGELVARDGQRTAVMFGRERVGLTNDEVSLADAIITFPVSPDFPSLNLAQAVLLVGYAWRQASGRARAAVLGRAAVAAGDPRGADRPVRKPGGAPSTKPGSTRRRSARSSPATCATCSTA